MRRVLALAITALVLAGCGEGKPGPEPAATDSNPIA